MVSTDHRPTVYLITLLCSATLLPVHLPACACVYKETLWLVQKCPPIPIYQVDICNWSFFDIALPHLVSLCLALSKSAAAFVCIFFTPLVCPSLLLLPFMAMFSPVFWNVIRVLCTLLDLSSHLLSFGLMVVAERCSWITRMRRGALLPSFSKSDILVESVSIVLSDFHVGLLLCRSGSFHSSTCSQPIVRISWWKVIQLSGHHWAEILMGWNS